MHNSAMAMAIYRARKYSKHREFALAAALLPLFCCCNDLPFFLGMLRSDLLQAKRQADTADPPKYIQMNQIGVALDRETGTACSK